MGLAVVRDDDVLLPRQKYAVAVCVSVCGQRPCAQQLAELLLFC